jgi:hypothetical protein
MSLHSSRKARSRAAGTFRPRLEVLEDRTVPASLQYSTLLNAYAIFATAVDSAGDLYVTGSANALQPTPGAFETSGSGTFVAKLSPTGTVLYATYLGDSSSSPYSYQNAGTGIAVDSAGDAYVIGQNTNVPTTPNAIASSAASGNVFVAELNPTGSALIYSTYLPGAVGYAGYQTVGNSGAIAVDAYGNIDVAGAAEAGFPVTSNAFQTTWVAPAGEPNAFFAKIDPTLSGSASLLYGTYLGGSGVVGDQATGIALDGAANVYLTGYTSSSNFPTTAGAFQRTNAANGSAFVTKFNPALSGAASLIYSTYLGGDKKTGYVSTGGALESQQNNGGIAVDSAGNAYITGSTLATNFPTTAGAFQVLSGFKKNASSYYYPAAAFLTKLNATGTALVYSTYLGAGGLTTSRGSSVAVDANGDAYLAGYTNSTAFPTKNSLQTPNSSGYTTFVTAMNPSGSGLLFSSYLRSAGGESVALDPAANMYVAGGGAAAKISAVVPTFVVTGFPSPTTAGQSATITVQAMNGGVLNPAYTGTVHFTSSDPQAVLPANAHLVNGSGTFSVTLKTAGVQSITVSDSANGMAGSESGILVNAGPAAAFALTAPPTALAGVAFTVTVMVVDAYGNAATFYSGTVSITNTDPLGTLPNPYTYDDDCFTFSMILKTLGTQSIKATDLGLPSIEGLWTINADFRGGEID